MPTAPRTDPTGATLEVLYFDGCPNYNRLLPVLHELAATHRVELQQLRIETAEEAEKSRFLGSPTVRFNGVDVEPGAHARTDFGMKCRLYRSVGGQCGSPPRAWIERALSEAYR